MDFRFGRVRSGSYIIMFFVLFVYTVMSQITARAYDAEFSALHPDEAPHFINSLLIARYITEGLGTSPMTFAKNFSMHYPKVSIGHWPPAFYVLGAVWLIVATQTKTAFLILSAMITAGLGTLVGNVVMRRTQSLLFGFMCGFAVIWLPIIRENTTMVMVDIFIAFMEISATLVYVHYMIKPTWKSSLLFSILAVFAILSKGNGMAIALMPPIAVLLNGQFSLMRKFSFWIPPLVVIPICFPWYVATYALLHDGFIYPFGMDYTLMAIKANFANIITSMGGIVTFSLVGCVGAFFNGFGFRTFDRTLRIDLVALALSVFIFQVVIPADVDPRYMIAAMIPLFLLSVIGVMDILVFLLTVNGAFIAGTLVVFFGVLMLPQRDFQKPLYGMKRAAHLVVSDFDWNAPIVLIASDARGEGAFISEMALQDTNRGYYVARGFKLLGSADFLAQNYIPRYTDADTLAQHLKDVGIHYVVIDTAQNSMKYLHTELLMKAGEGWTEVGKFAHYGVDGETLVYRIDGSHLDPVNGIIAATCAWKPEDSKIDTSIGIKKPFDSCP